jgi:quercetin dioxygenase-like cupin family protein
MTIASMGSVDIRPEESILGIGYKLLIAGVETGGAYELMLFVVPPGAGPPPHAHAREDESFYIVAGEFEVLVGGQTQRLKAGDFVHLPRGVPHAFRNVGDTMGRFLCYVVPGQLEGFFAAFARAWPTDMEHPPVVSDDDIGKLMAAAAKYEIQIFTGPDH